MHKPSGPLGHLRVPGRLGPAAGTGSVSARGRRPSEEQFGLLLSVVLLHKRKGDGGGRKSVQVLTPGLCLRPASDSATEMAWCELYLPAALC